MTDQRLYHRELEAFLDFHVAAGVTVALDEAPHNWFMETPAPASDHKSASLRQRPATPASSPPAAARSLPFTDDTSEPSGQEAVMAARVQAAAAETLGDLRAALERFDGCPLKRSAKSLVFAAGNPEGRVMLVGEAPGRDEDQQGFPFVGRSGQLLDKMLAAIGLDRHQAYIANTIPWRPPGNRTPSPIEQEICGPFIRRQIELADPDVLVFLGAASAKQLTGKTDGILKLRGRWMTYDTGQRTIRAIATLHPAYLLRQPGQKRLAWQDFLAIRRALDESTPPSA